MRSNVSNYFAELYGRHVVTESELDALRMHFLPPPPDLSTLDRTLEFLNG